MLMKILKSSFIFGFILILIHCNNTNNQKINLVDSLPEKLQKNVNDLKYSTWGKQVFLPKITKDYFFDPQSINISKDGLLYISDRSVKVFSLSGKLIHAIPSSHSFKILFDHQGNYYTIRKNSPDEFGGRRYIFINKFNKNNKFLFSYEKIFDYKLYDAAIDSQNNIYLILNSYQVDFPIIKISPNGIITKINKLKSNYIQNLKIDSNGNFWLIHYQTAQPDMDLFYKRVYQISVFNSKWDHIANYKPILDQLFIPVDMDFDKYGNIFIQNIDKKYFGSLNEEQRKKNVPSVLKFDKNFKFLKKWENKSSLIKVIHSKYLYASEKINQNNQGPSKILKYDLEGKLIETWQINGCENGKFNQPFQGKIDQNGNLFIKDKCFGERIQKFDSNGNYLKSWKSTVKKDQKEMDNIFINSNPQYSFNDKYGNKYEISPINHIITKN